MSKLRKINTKKQLYCDLFIPILFCLLYPLFDIGARWGSVVNVTLRPFYPQEKNLEPTKQVPGWASEPVWTGTKNLAPTGFRNLNHPARSLNLCRNVKIPGPGTM
jgi:hypothetical protein